MNKERLFEYIKTQNHSKLLDLLSRAFDILNTNQRHDVFGKIDKEAPPLRVDGKKLLVTIKQFYQKSISGHYYKEFRDQIEIQAMIDKDHEEWLAGLHLGDDV